MLPMSRIGDIAMGNLFYVYTYLDPRKPARYCYESVCFLYEPFYIGKGRGSRCLDHLKFLSRKTNKHFKGKLTKILSKFSNMQEYIIVLEGGITESKAFDLERQLIAQIGRADLKLGPLCNLTNGGEGTGGVVMSSEARKKRAESNTGKKRSLKTRRLLSEINKGKNNPMFGKLSPKKGTRLSQETKDRISQSLKGKTLGRAQSEETRRKRSESLKGEKSPNFGKQLAGATKIKMSLAHLGKTHTEGAKQRISAAKSGEGNANAKLTAKQVHQIHMLLKLGFKYSCIADMFERSPGAILSIKHGKNWKSIYRVFYNGGEGSSASIV